MIGFQILALQQEDNTYLCDKVDYFSVALYMLNSQKQIDKEAKRIANLFGTVKHEFILTFEDLKAINVAHTCIEGRENYHPLACDGIIIIPKTKDCFVQFVKKFKLDDIICHENNFASGLLMFGNATELDVENFSDKNGLYLKKYKFHRHKTKKL